MVAKIRYHNGGQDTISLWWPRCNITMVACDVAEGSQSLRVGGWGEFHRSLVAEKVADGVSSVKLKRFRGSGSEE